MDEALAIVDRFAVPRVRLMAEGADDVASALLNDPSRWGPPPPPVPADSPILCRTQLARTRFILVWSPIPGALK